MNATTVTTKDTKNSSVTYTTTDKLYALQGDYDNDQYLWAGTDDSTVLAMSSYLRNGEWFWLRSPYGGSGDFALCADRGYYVILGRVDIDSGSLFSPLPIWICHLFSSHLLRQQHHLIQNRKR